MPASEFRPYAPRARWIRTANDSYFTAMTYPEGLPALLQPSDLHDAIWGVFAAVYGGAIHPTAEGHAAMADAALPAVRDVLGLPAPARGAQRAAAAAAKIAVPAVAGVLALNATVWTSIGPRIGWTMALPVWPPCITSPPKTLANVTVFSGNYHE